MASVQWTKFKGHGAVKAVLRHNCSDTREAQQNHSNKQLDTSKTHLNYGMYNQYAEACKRYDERIAELAPKSAKRKDQVTGLGLEFPVPAGLPADQQVNWFSRTAGIICDMFGDDNVMGFHVHRDEEHEYLHHETGELTMSRVHAHAVVVPEYEGRLCAKQVESRANIRKLNNAIEEMSTKEFGVHFLEGKGERSSVKVEDLKRKSAAKLAELADELERREARLNARESELDAYERALNAREESLQRRERALEAAEAAPAKPAAAAPGRKSVSLNEVKQRTRSQLRTVDGYNGQGPQFGR